MAKRVIVSASDDRFFPFLKGLMLSIDGLRPRTDETLAVLDVGLSDDNVRWLAARDVRMVRPGWDVELPEKQPDAFKAFTARPFLPEHFPGYDTIVWLDADIWLQTWDAVHWLGNCADQGYLGIVPEIDRAYASSDVAFRKVEGYYVASYGEKGRQLARLPIMNSGAFGLPAKSPFWQVWQQNMRTAIDGNLNLFVEQNAFNRTIYDGFRRALYLPSLFNWLCHKATPMYCRQRSMLVEPQPPFQVISAIHLAGKSKRKGVRPIRVMQGGQPVEMALTFSGAERMRGKPSGD